MAGRRLRRRLTPPRLRSPALVSLTFDDGTADHLLAGRLLAEQGLAGTFYVNSGRIGSGPGSLAWEGVEELATAGHEIGGHTTDHLDLASASAEEARAQIEEDRRALTVRGHEARSFAYPYGSLGEGSRSLVAAVGYLSGRRAWGLAGDGDPEREATESLPPADAYALRTVPSLERETTLAWLQRLVTRAEFLGGWLPLVFHRLDGEGRYSVGEVVFREFVGWLAARQGVSVRTVGDVMELR